MQSENLHFTECRTPLGAQNRLPDFTTYNILPQKILKVYYIILQKIKIYYEPVVKSGVNTVNFVESDEQPIQADQKA